MNNDLISRSALKDFINKVCFSEEWIKYRVDYGSKGQIDCILAYIDNAPTVPLPDFKEGYKQAIIDGKTNYSRPQGEWAFDEKGSFYCDQCGKYPHDQYATTNFCPNCGADMRISK